MCMFNSQGGETTEGQGLVRPVMHSSWEGVELRAPNILAPGVRQVCNHNVFEA